MPITVFTCACNRPMELKRLYESLRRQTRKDFIWLIIDDSTTEEVKVVVEELIAENQIQIEYHKLQHRGKHWAVRTGDQWIKTPYVVDIDDDDELTDNAIEVFSDTWDKIEQENRKDIGMVCGQTVDETGKNICYHGWKGEYLDTDYITMEWSQRHPSENIISRRAEAFSEAHAFCDDGKWIYDKVSLVLESVLWNRVARKYKARYIKDTLRIYHHNDQDSLTRRHFDEQKCLNYTCSNYVMLNELRGRLLENPRDLLKYVAEYMACGKALKIKNQELLTRLEGPLLKTIAFIITPVAVLVAKKLKVF